MIVLLRNVVTRKPPPNTWVVNIISTPGESRYDWRQRHGDPE